MVCYIKSTRSFFLLFALFATLTRFLIVFFARLSLVVIATSFPLFYFFSLKKKRTLYNIHDTTKLKYQILPSQKCNLGWLKLGLRYNNGLWGLCCPLYMFDTPILVIRRACHLFSSLRIFLPTKETNTLVHLHNTSKLE
jgi:hypothetical protein